MSARDDQPATGQLTKETREGAVEAMKAMADYGRPKNVKVSVETRGAGTPEYVQQIGMKPWEFMLGIIKDAGADSNVDIGNVGAMNQQELHDCIKPGSQPRPATCTSSRIPSGTSARQSSSPKAWATRGCTDRGGEARGRAHRLQHDSGQPRVENVA